MYFAFLSVLCGSAFFSALEYPATSQYCPGYQFPLETKGEALTDQSDALYGKDDSHQLGLKALGEV